MSAVTVSWKFSKQGLFLPKLKKAVNNADFLNDIGQEYLKRVEKYVPKDTGTLRESGRISNIDVADARFYVTWDTDGMPGGANFPDAIRKGGGYAHYVYEGEVYGPNEFKNGGWHSPTETKEPEGRPMTYHTPGTQDHWDVPFRRGGSEYKEYRKACKDILKGYVK